MKRREFLGLLGAAMAVPGMAPAQTPGRMFRLGTLSPVFPLTDGSTGQTLIKTLSGYGYVLGQNLTVDLPRRGR